MRLAVLRQLDGLVREHDGDVVHDGVQQVAGFADQAAVDSPFEGLAREVHGDAGVDCPVDRVDNRRRRDVQSRAVLRAAKDLYKFVIDHIFIQASLASGGDISLPTGNVKDAHFRPRAAKLLAAHAIACKARAFMPPITGAISAARMKPDNRLDRYIILNARQGIAACAVTGGAGPGTAEED
jgi:hypothetical protein